MKIGSHVLPRETNAGRTPQTLSSRPEHSLPLSEGNAEWRDLVSRANHICRRTALIVLVLTAGVFLAMNAHGQSAEGPLPVKAGRFNCTPAPCVLPPTQASEGGGTVTDTAIVSNPLNSKQLLLGSVDFNCSAERSNLGFHFSMDRGSTWERVECMPAISINQQIYLADDEPSVGYDRNGNAYISGLYFDTGGYGNHGLVAVQKSSDGTHWSKPVIALRLPGQTFPYMTRLVVDGHPGSPGLNSLYVSGVMALGQGKTQVLVSHSTDGGATWKQAALDAVQKYPDQDELTRIAVGKDGTAYATWLRCASPCRTAHIMFSKSADGGNTWSSPQRIAKVTMPLDWSLPNTFERAYNYRPSQWITATGPTAGVCT